MEYYTEEFLKDLPKKADYNAIEYIKEQIYDVTTDDHICECDRHVCEIVNECLCKLDKLMKTALKEEQEN